MAASIAMHSATHSATQSRSRHRGTRDITRGIAHSATVLQQACVLALSAAVVTGCGSDSTAPVAKTQADLLWSLAFNWHSVNLALQAPYDTARIVATPRTAAGDILSDSNPVQYVTKDSSITVSSTGLITAHYLTSGATVVAKKTVNGITLADTALVQVVSAPPPSPLVKLSIQPRADGLPFAHTTLDDDGFTEVTYDAIMANGDSLCTVSYCTTPVQVDFASGDSMIATLDPYGYVYPKMVGRFMVYASALAYGVPLRDSLSFAIGEWGRALTYVAADSSHLPFTPYVTHPPRNIKTISVGGRLGVTDYSAELLEISYPSSQLGMTYLFKPNPHQAKDTLSPPYGFVFVKFDSVGTYTLTYRMLTSNTSVSESIKVVPYP